jgi:serine/threonine-protein kinase
MGRIELVVRREGAFARAYARKRLLPGLAGDGALRALFIEEARVAGLVRHANVVPVLDVGEDDDGPYLVMDYVDGVSVADLIVRFGARLPLQVCLEIARQIAEGLHAAHELVSPEGKAMGLVHRDLSATNVLVGFDGTARVTDFGVARALDRGSLTRPGVPKGKLSYMAPEQIRSEPLDLRTDLFGLGVLLSELLKGGKLYGDVAPSEIARRTLEEPPPDPGDERDDLPPDLVALVFELLARRAEDRPRDARAVAGRLSAILADLRAEEGPIDVGELVRARFHTERAANAKMLAEALRDEDPTRPDVVLPEAAIGPPKLPAPREPRGVVEREDRAPSRERGQPLTWLGALASAVVIALAASALVAALTRPDPPEPQPVPIAPSAPPVSAPEPEIEAVDPATAEPDDATGPLPERSRRRRARARAATEPPEPPEPTTKIRTWSWE